MKNKNELNFKSDKRRWNIKFDKNDITIGVLGGHSALDICSGAKKHGFKTVGIIRKDREKTYKKYYGHLFDEIIMVDKFSDMLDENIQSKLLELNTVFIHSRYFWTYFNYEDVENKFKVPIFGSRHLVKYEERDIENNQYDILDKASIRKPNIYNSPEEIDGPVIVKVNEAERGYERAFFYATSTEEYYNKVGKMISDGIITRYTLNSAVIEECLIGAQVNFNYFYSPITKELELMSTDMRRQTNLDGLLRLPAKQQLELDDNVSMVETGHVAITIKESLLEQVFTIGESFVWAVNKMHPPGIIGPFSLQGAVVSKNGKEELVIFDVSMRIPGAPGTIFTPYTYYKYGEPISYGERIAMELKKAIKEDKLSEVLT